MPDEGAVGGLSDSAVVNHYSRQAARNGGNYYIPAYHVDHIMRAAGQTKKLPKSLAPGIQGPQREAYYTSDNEQAARAYMSREIGHAIQRHIDQHPAALVDPFDYATVTVSACLYACKSHSMTFSSYGVYYAEGLGAGMKGVGVSLMFGNIPAARTEEAMAEKTMNFIKGYSSNAGGGFILGGGYTYSFGNGGAYEAGLTTPGASLTVNKTMAHFEWGNNHIWEGSGSYDGFP